MTRRRSGCRHLVVGVFAVGVFVLAAACGQSDTTLTPTSAPSAASTTPATSTTSTTVTRVTSVTTATAATTPTTGATRSTMTTSGQKHVAVVDLSDGDSGRSLTVHPGDSVIVVLHSTYWSMLSPSNQGVLELQGSPVVVPQFQGCVPGQGCGTVTAHYLAVSAGQSQLGAHRDICGEALMCAPAQKNWQATIAVT